MGKVEKIVVLGVLLAIVSILVWSRKDANSRGSEEGAVVLGGYDPDAQAKPQPGSSMQEVAYMAGGRDGELQAGLQPATHSEQLVGSEEPSERIPTAGLLSAETTLTTGFSELTPEPVHSVELDESWAIVTSEGLSALAFHPDAMAYQVQEGDDWASLARTFYGSNEQVQLLRLNNEGLEAPQPGEQVLIPLYDDLAEETVVWYEVLEGESLWKIAKKSYGQGHRWEEIYRANRDVLRSPDQVAAGMKLRIP